MTVQTVDPADTLAVLKAAEEWLSDPEHWTTRVLWRDANDSVLAETAMEADQRRVGAVARTCASGALVLVAGGNFPDGAVCVLTRALGCDSGGIVSTNDGENGYLHIMAGLRKAIETLEAKADDD